MRSRIQTIQQWVTARTAAYMFWCSFAFLVCLAFLVVLWVDVPNLRENARLMIDHEFGQPAFQVGTTIDRAQQLKQFLALPSPARQLELFVLLVMACIWPLVIVESAIHWLTRPWTRANLKYHAFGLLYCICPALRMCARSPEMRDRLWLPGLGWRRADKRLRRRLKRYFGVPMILIALMIMPILIIEFFLRGQVADHLWLRLLLHVGTGVIWFSFAIEFILMVSVADNKLDYCKKNWLDLAIILLPLISFLRSLQTMRATRLAKLMRIQQLTQIARVYRLRGTAIKAFRALVALELLNRILRTNPDRTLDKLKRQLAEVEEEAKQLRRDIARLERSRNAQRWRVDEAETVAAGPPRPALASAASGTPTPASDRV